MTKLQLWTTDGQNTGLWELLYRPFGGLPYSNEKGVKKHRNLAFQF